MLPEVRWMRGISFELLLIPDVFKAPDGEILNPIPHLPLEPQRLKLCHFRRLLHSLRQPAPGWWRIFPSFLRFTSRWAITEILRGRHCACLKLKARGCLQAWYSRVGMRLWQAFYTARVIKGGSLVLLKEATENRMLASLATLLSN